MKKLIRGMENLQIGKYYKVFHKDYGLLHYGILQYITYDVAFWDNDQIIPMLYFKDHGNVYATDCGIIPYSHNKKFNTSNHTYQIN